MNLNNGDTEDMKHGFTRYGSEFKKIATKSLQIISEQGFGAFMLLALEKIRHKEYGIVPPISNMQIAPRLNVLYQFVAYLGQRFGCRYVIDVGCEYVEKLVQLYPQFEIIGIDFGKSSAVVN